jgi:subtilisin family serine protease
MLIALCYASAIAVACCRRGVAYKAQILAYKVAGSCKAAGSVSTNATLAAIQKASDDGADVLNLSYGDFRSGSYTDMRYANALGSAMQRGALVAIASGNDGAFGERAGFSFL